MTNPYLALARTWKGENGDYPESKEHCAADLERLVAEQAQAVLAGPDGFFIHGSKESIEIVRDRIFPKFARWSVRSQRIAAKLLEQYPMLKLVDAERSDSGNTPGHLRWMLEELAGGRVDGPTKSCRWLGYAQAMMVISGYCTLNDMKTINLAGG